MTPFYKQAAELLEAASNIAIISHYNPDGDAMGSGLALLNYFKSQHRAANFIVPSEFPDFLSWLPLASETQVFSTHPETVNQTIDRADLIILVDFNTMDRIEDLAPIVNASGKRLMLIDHHPQPDVPADWILSDTSVSSTAELIYRFLDGIGKAGEINLPTARCIYTGIMTDTGNFSHNSSRPETFEIVAHLLHIGVDKDAIHAAVFHNFSANRMQLLGHVLKDRMKILPEYHTAYLYLTQKDLSDYNHITGDTEGFVNIPFSIKGILFSVLFIEKEEHIKLSLRSKGDFSVNDFTRLHFSGGGHKHAAGGKSFTSLENSLQQFESLLPSYSDALRTAYQSLVEAPAVPFELQPKPSDS